MTDDARKADVWMPFLIDRYLGDTTLLTTEQHGAYFLILLAMWKAGGTLPAGDVQLASAAKLTPARWRKMKPALSGFFRSDGNGGIYQKRLHAELERAKTNTSNKSTAGRKGARSRWQSDDTAMAAPLADEMTEGMAEAMTDTMAQPSQKPWHGDGSPPLSLPQDSEKEAVASLSSACASPSEACKAMREAGIAEVNPNHPDLIAMLAQGMTVGELVSASTTAIKSHAEKPFKYALTVARSEREKLAKRAALAPAVDSRSSLTGNARFMASATPTQWPPASDLDLTEPETSHVADARARG
jgi:uncharacterized protein YdaU (DUF1376 family)